MAGWLYEEPKRKRKAITEYKRGMLWNKYIGASKAVGECYACKKPIHIQEFEVGHNKARAKGGSDEISDLRPICHNCNKNMGTMSIETFKAKLLGKAKGTTGGTTASKTKACIALDSVKTCLTKRGYDVRSKRHGFDFVGVDDSHFGSDRYIVVGFNRERTVSSDYVLKFKKKARAYYENTCEYYTGTPRIDAVVAYSGALSKDAPMVAKGSKPTIKFKKF